MKTASLNCAGQGCPERQTCRRFLVRVNAPQCTKEHPYGEWASFDLERLVKSASGTCPHFTKYRPT